MTQQLLDHWPSVVTAQLIGVGLAWLADAVSWRARQSAKIVLGFNFLVLAALLPRILVSRAALMVLSLALVWLLVATWARKRQLRLSFSAAFVGALVQQSCFLVVLAVGVWVWIINWRLLGNARLNSDLLNSVWCGSAIVTYLLLSLFRPTIFGTWQRWRQNPRKDQPLR